MHSPAQFLQQRLEQIYAGFYITRSHASLQLSSFNWTTAIELFLLIVSSLQIPNVLGKQKKNSTRNRTKNKCIFSAQLHNQLAGWQNQWPPGRRFPPSFFACPSHFSCTQNPLFLPFQTPSTQARTSQKEFQILAFLHVTGWKINLIRYIFNASCPPINLER